MAAARGWVAPPLWRRGPRPGWPTWLVSGLGGPTERDGGGLGALGGGPVPPAAAAGGGLRLAATGGGVGPPCAPPLPRLGRAWPRGGGEGAMRGGQRAVYFGAGARWG